MTKVPDRLQQVADEVAIGKHPADTVRNLLSWFGVERRGARKRMLVASVLDELHLATVPDFNFAYIDAQITFHRKAAKAPSVMPQPGIELCTNEVVVEKDSDSSEDPSPRSTAAVAAVLDPALRAALADPTYRIGKLPAANNRPKYVAPDATIQAAMTTMLAHNFTQLPVMTSEREVKGLISWKSIAAKIGLGKSGAGIVRDCMGRHQEITENDSLFSAIRVIAEHEAVLVRAMDKCIIGIVTTTDLALTFDQLGEPFLLLGEIENHLRGILARLPLQDLRFGKDPADMDRKIESVADLSFGEYLRILQRQDLCDKLGLQIDRATFVKELESVRDIRNDVMHFDPEGLGPGDLATLRRIGKFMQVLGEIGVSRDSIAQ